MGQETMIDLDIFIKKLTEKSDDLLEESKLTKDTNSHVMLGAAGLTITAIATSLKEAKK